MNVRLILRAFGVILCCEMVAMLPSLGLSIAENGRDLYAFVYSILLLAIFGLPLIFIKPKHTQVGYKEGFIIATFGWLLLSMFGMMPYILSGALSHPLDAFFESISGFTTTGASVIDDVEVLSKGILFWRSITHWLGGMGIVVLTLAIMPSLNIAGFHMFKAEVPGPQKTKVLPRVAKTARQLYTVYLIITIMAFVLLKCAGMPWFETFIHTFSTVATGGFSSRNTSIGHFDNLPVEIIIFSFMIICGLNFGLLINVFKGNPKALFKDTEARTFLSIIAIAIILISINLVNHSDYHFLTAIREGMFQVAAIITGTGFATVDYNQWPDFSRYVLVLLMFIGACSGSTGGGIKVIRYVILFKSLTNQMAKLIHPRAVLAVRVNNSVVQAEVVHMVQNFFVLFLLLFVLATGLILATGIDLITASTAVIATLSNTGPGLGLVGPASTFSELPMLAKFVLSFCMLTGRLELFTVLVIFNMRFWR